MKCIFCSNPARVSAEPLSNKKCCHYCKMRFVDSEKFALSNNGVIRVKLHHMEGEPQMKKGLMGKFVSTDDAGQLHVKWENGSTLPLNAEVDVFSII